ncbi:hypothetical protein [Sodalis sp. RH20]|uniref:hypothetical protein n=1 Tax=unclassified Sodalis (in: enterobacteria) TaxID=2636512 RepID=UPI0039B39884
MVNLINYGTSNAPSASSFYLKPINSLHSFSKVIIKARNINHPKEPDIHHQGNQTGIAGDKQRSTPGSDDRINYLYQCANELIRNKDCLLTAGGVRYINITLMDTTINLPVRHITLPSGRAILAGYLDSRLVVVHENNYYIEDLLQAPLTVTSALGQLLAHLAQGYNTGYILARPAWLDTALNWFANARDPLIFPQTSGLQLHEPAGRQTLYSAAAEISAHPAPAGDSPRPLEVKPAPALPTDAVMPHPLGARADGSPEIGRFFIDDQEFNLTPANPAGRAVLHELGRELQATGVNLANGNRETLIELDKLIAAKAEDIFYYGLYFKDKAYVLHVLILKTLTEKLLTSLLGLSATDTDGHRLIKQHMAEYKTLHDYIPDIEGKLVEAYEDINIDIISHTVALLKNRDFASVVNEQILKIKNTSFYDHAFHVEIYNTLKVMKIAHDEYTAQLFQSDHTTLERVTYTTNQDIYTALIDNNKKALTESLLKLRFYYIFEYTRFNEISVHTNNFLLPGEMTNLGYPFVADETIIDIADMERLFINEAENYIHFRHNNHTHLNFILKMVELSRLNEVQPEDEASWQEKNIAPWDQAYAILSEILIANYQEQEKFHTEQKWYNDLKINSHAYKSTLILLAYFKNLQRIFINIIDYFRGKNITLVADNAEQYIAAAKIEAMRTETKKTQGHHTDYQMLLSYQRRVLEGDVELMMKASVFWYLSTKNNFDEDLLSSLQALYILRSFVSEQQHFFIEYKTREQVGHLSIYQLSPSDKKDSLEDYYKQFYDYKHFYAGHEARKSSLAAINLSAIDYVDAIYPPKEIFCFEVFSRNYVSNSLSPFNYVYFPHKNIGYLSLLRLQSGKLFLLSTLSGYVFIHDIDKFDNQPFVQQMMAYWRGYNANKQSGRPEPLGCGADFLAGLFPDIDANSGDLTTMIDLVLSPPEDEPMGMHAAPFTLVAVNSSDIISLIKPYISQPIDSSPPVSLDTPLITNIDYLSHATLLTIADRLKETLRNHSWPEYIASFIPFFDTLCKHWYDKEHEIKFNEIMFDLFDLITTIVFMGGQFKKIPENTLKHALYKAIKNNTPREMLQRFILNELVLSAPEVGKKLAAASVKEFASFLFPLQPYGSLLFFLTLNIKNKITEIVSIVNEAIRAESRRKKNLRQAWKTDIDARLLEIKSTGVLVDKITQNKLYYVVNDNDYFKVFWDKHYGGWRIINKKMTNEKDFAVPVVRSSTGNWIASVGSRSSHFIASYDFYEVAKKNRNHIEIIQCEAAPTLSKKPDIDNSTIDFYKRVIRFYLYKNDYVRDIINQNIQHENFIGRFHRSFFFRQEIIDSLKFNGYSQDEEFLVSAIRALSEKQEGIMRFRAICGWKNKHSTVPETYFALTLDIENYKFIIDLKEMRGSFILLDTMDVFTENEWLSMYNKSPLEFELIKYKDIDSLEDVNYLTYREATSPSSILKNGFLLKEPTWYFPLIIRSNNAPGKLKYSTGYMQSSDFRLAARALRHSTYTYTFKEEFPLHVLYKTKKLDNESAIKLTRMINQAKIDNFNSHAILSDKFRITSIENMLKINEGNLLALYSTANLLEHLLLCQGHGRFIGIENHFFDPDLPARVSIVIAEQMGTFGQGLLTLRHNGKNLFVMAGKAFGSKIEIPTLMDELPREKVPIYLSDGQQRGYREQQVSREKILLGKDCHIDLISDAKTRLRIKLHGAPFNVNNMDAIEFSDIVRGLSYLDNAKFRFQDLESIELFSCYSGYGHRFSTGQILANELGLPIKAYPYKISDDIRQRRPEWFTWFRPGKQHMSPARGSVDSSHGSEDGSFSQSQRIHRRLHDLISFVLNMHKRILVQRNKRDRAAAPNNTTATGPIPASAPNAGQMPLIYLDILQQLYGYAPPNADIPRHIQSLSPQSLHILDAIIAEYHLTGEEDRFIVEQAFLDVILSLDEYRYLSDWFANEINPGDRH